MLLPLFSAALLGAPNTSATQQPYGENQQPPVIVTAQRLPSVLPAYLAAAEVVERDDITRFQAKDVPELLRRTLGVDIARTGGPGGQTSVFMRGTNANHVLVLIDGVRVASSTTGAFGWEQLPLSHIERIELVRGPRAALYGSDAIGGVIQIFTRAGMAASMQLSVGSERDGELALGQGFGNERNNLHVALSRRDRRGFSAQNVNGFGFHPDDDGVEATRLSLRSEHALADAVALSLSGLGSNSEIEFDQGVSDLRARSIGAALTLDGELTRHEVRLGHARETLETADFDARFLTRRQQFDYLLAWNIDPGQSLGAGLSYLRDRGANTDLVGNAAYSETRDSRGAWLQYRAAIERFSFDATGRWDDYDGFGSTSTGQAAVGYDLAGNQFRLSWGQGFRAPNSNELYSPGFGGSFAGNPRLAPERSRTIELGVLSELGAQQSLEASLFQSRIDDLIAFSGPNFRAINIREADIDGAELGWRWDRSSVDGSQWRVGYTWLDARDAVSGRPLLRRARNKLALDADWQWREQWQFGISGQWIDQRLDVGNLSLPSYALLDLRASLEFQAGWFLDAGLNNALDRQYEAARGFNSPGREWNLRLRYGL